MNVGAPTYWNDALEFANLLKQTIPVTSYEGGFINDVPLGDTGWPSVSIPHNGHKFFMDAGINAHLPIIKEQLKLGGKYIVRLHGRGRIRIGDQYFENVGSGTKDILAYFSEERLPVQILEGSSAFSWGLYYPEQAGSHFHSYFVDTLKPFGGIRLMDWKKTNGSKEKDWIDGRVHLGMSETSGDYGASWKSGIRLANESSSDLWVCIPHGATETYVVKLAELLSAEFKGQRIILEYSNECWNWSRAFRDQLKHCQEHGEGIAKHLDGMDAIAAGYGDLANRVFKIFKGTYGGNAVVDYCCAWMSVANSTSKVAFDYCKEMTMIAHAPYVFLSNSVDGGWKHRSVEEVLDMLLDQGINRSQANLEKWQGWADQRGVRHALYECGQHVDSSDHTYEITRHPRMYDVMSAFDTAVQKVDPSIISAYFTLWGPARRNTNFGLQEYSGDVWSPRWRAVRDAANVR